MDEVKIIQPIIAVVCFPLYFLKIINLEIYHINKIYSYLFKLFLLIQYKKFNLYVSIKIEKILDISSKIIKY